jgi:hypothetical protein
MVFGFYAVFSAGKRLIVSWFKILIDVAKHFATNILGAGFFISHYAFGGGNDSNTETIHYTTDISRLGILTKTRAAYTLEVLDSRLF